MNKTPKSNIFFISRCIHSEHDKLTGPQRVNYELKKELNSPAIYFFDPKKNFLQLFYQLFVGNRENRLHFGDQSFWSALFLIFAVIFRYPNTYTTFHGLAVIEREYGNNRISLIGFQKIFLLLCKHIICVSDLLEKKIKNRTSSVILAIPNGCDISLNEKHYQHNPKRKKPRIVFAGGTRCEKGIEFCVKSLNHLNEPVSLEVYGTKGACHNSLKAFSDNVDLTYYEFVDQKVLFDNIRSANLFVSFSLYEPFGMAPLESLFLKTPVIATRSMGLYNYLNEIPNIEYMVQFIDYGDVKAFKSSFNFLKKNKRPEAINWDQLQEKFSWDNISKKYLEIWDKP